jgi:hypothetical protein
VFVEGERTEDGYFKFWWRRNRDKVIVHIDKRNGAPITFVEHAVARKKHEERERSTRNVRSAENAARPMTKCGASSM